MAIFLIYGCGIVFLENSLYLTCVRVVCTIKHIFQSSFLSLFVLFMILNSVIKYWSALISELGKYLLSKMTDIHKY